MENVDLRVVKTKRSLSSALLTLLEQNNFAAITVNDICVEALVGRSTFYSHFDDKYDLLRFSMETMKQRLFSEGDVLFGEEGIATFLRQVKDNGALVRNLISVSLDIELIHMMQEAFQKEIIEIIERIERTGTAVPERIEPLEVVSMFYASGVTSSVMLWVQTGTKYSIEEMARCLYRLIPHPMPDHLSALGQQ